MRDEKVLAKLLYDFRRGKLSSDYMLKRLKGLVTHDMGFARVDGSRAIRCGFPEVIYGEHKTYRQIAEIAERISGSDGRVLITRISPEKFRKVKKAFRRLSYNAAGRIAHTPLDSRFAVNTAAIPVITGGTADIPVAEEAAVTVEVMGARAARLYDAGVAGLHRIMDNIERLAGSRAIVVVAGMEGALASVVGGLVSVPVIAVPTSVGYGANFGGIAPLLTMLNSCAPNVSVVNIDNGFGAGYIAALISKL